MAVPRSKPEDKMRKVDPEKHAEKRRHILKAAAGCFRRKGFQAASISDICAEAKMSPGHLYHYFASKEAIVKAMIQISVERAASRAEQVLQHGNIVDGLLSQVDRCKVDESRRMGALMVEMTAEASRNPAVAKLLRDRDRPICELIAGLLRRGQQLGQVDPDLNPQPVASVLMAAVQGLTMRMVNGLGSNADRDADAMKLMISRFLEPRPVSRMRPEKKCAPKKGVHKLPAARKPRGLLIADR
jgi:TetR/AcrR family transcriptional regulator, repressor for uid operon